MRRILSGITLTLLISMLTLAFNVHSVRSEPATIIVPDDFSTIQEAINAANQGDTIYVKTGIYNENVVVNKALLLIGENKEGTIIDGNGNGDVVKVTAGNTLISNFTIRNSGKEWSDSGIALIASYCNITNNILINNTIGVDIRAISYFPPILPSFNIISYNIITENKQKGILICGSYHRIIGNSITNNEYCGIFIAGPGTTHSNVISNNNIANNYYGIELYGGDQGSSQFNTISWNTIIENTRSGISIYKSYHNQVFGNDITENYQGIDLFLSLYNNISYNKITNNSFGIDIAGSNNVIQSNTFTNNGLILRGPEQLYVENNTVNGEPLVYLYSVSNLTIVNAGQVILVKCNNIQVEGLNLRRASVAIQLWETQHTIISANSIETQIYSVYVSLSSNILISRNNITNAFWAIRLASSNYTKISKNDITNNKVGIDFWWSSNNVICKNNIQSNEIGVCLTESSDNRFHHNNLINNTRQVYDLSWDYPAYNDPSLNIWDDGYPSGGNFWSDYNDTDLYCGTSQNENGSDGIGDTHYVIDANNVDRYPLMGPFNMFDAGVWNEVGHTIDIVSNSSVLGFEIDIPQKTISFNVTGLEETTGFCRIIIPNLIVQELWQGNYMVLLNGEPCPFRNWTDTTSTYIYINYTHSEHQITIIPELPTNIILILFLTSTMLATIFCKRKQIQKSKTPQFF